MWAPNLQGSRDAPSLYHHKKKSLFSAKVFCEATTDLRMPNCSRSGDSDVPQMTAQCGKTLRFGSKSGMGKLACLSPKNGCDYGSMNPLISGPSPDLSVHNTNPGDIARAPLQTNRRQFLFAAAAGLPLALPRVGFAAGAEPAPSRPPVVDTHVHCFSGKNDARFPYHPRAPYRPEPAATPQQLLQCMDEAGVDFAVIVHPEPYQDDHRYLEYCFDTGKSRFKGTCLVFSDRPESMAKLPDLAKRRPIVAVRVHAYAPDRLPPFGKPELRELWRIAGAHGLSVQIHFEPRYATGYEPLIKEFSDVKVIIDHLGRPFQGTPGEHEVVVRWSRYSNTVMKLSAIPASTAYPHRDIAPIIKRLTQEYGPERVIYGGGFGAEATGKSYRAAIEQARSHVSFLSTGDQAKLFGENAARLFGFKRA